MKLNLLSWASAMGVLALAACTNTNTDKACEDVTLASEQIQQCQILHRKIANAKNEPLIRTELERRYQQDCIDIRYYRDEHQIAICDNKEEIQEVREEAIDGKLPK